MRALSPHSRNDIEARSQVAYDSFGTQMEKKEYAYDHPARQNNSFLI
jgi:hypothetical protein